MSTKPFHPMTRTQAAKLIEEIRELAANGDERLARILEDARIPPLEVCGGAAHTNAYIDNCMRCAPRWGYTGAPVRIR